MARGDQGEDLRPGYSMLGLGLEVSSQVVAGLALGWVCDWAFGWGSTALLVGALAGVLVGLWTMILGAMRINRKLDGAERAAREAKRQQRGPQE